MAMQTTEAEALLNKIAEMLDKALANGDSLTAIAERSGVPQPRLSNIRRRQVDSFPKMDTLESIARALGYKVVVKIQKA